MNGDPDRFARWLWSVALMAGGIGTILSATGVLPVGVALIAGASAGIPPVLIFVYMLTIAS